MKSTLYIILGLCTIFFISCADNLYNQCFIKCFSGGKIIYAANGNFMNNTNRFNGYESGTNDFISISADCVLRCQSNDSL